jgi:hypothetical protein
MLKLLVIKFVTIVKIVGSWSCIDIDVRILLFLLSYRTITTAGYGHSTSLENVQEIRNIEKDQAESSICECMTSVDCHGTQSLAVI